MAWDVVSSLWASSLTQPILEAQLALVYAGAALAGLLVVRSGTYRALLGGAVVAITLVCVYSLATRLFPERLGIIDDFAGYRLAEPLGYWNALGMFAALGTILALGFAARGRSHAIRALAGASIAILVPTLFYERYWNQLRPAEVKVRDAHNLYLETLAETGPVGLSLLLGALFGASQPLEFTMPSRWCSASRSRRPRAE